MKLLFSAVMVLIASPALAGPPSPEAIERDISRHGAREIVSRLLADGDYDRIMDRIDSGDARWIAMAPRLAEGADAGAAEELPIALAFALPKNPGAVLKVLMPPNGLPIEDVCSAPFIEGTVKDVPAYVRRAKEAVAAVSDARLAKTKDACLAQLRTVKP